MPFSRPTLSQLIASTAQDIIAQNPGSSTLLKVSLLGVLGQVVAKLSHLHFGYLDYIAKQSTPVSATDEHLSAWAALKGVGRSAATSASGTATFTGSVGALIPASTIIRRISDQVAYSTTADVYTNGSGVALVTVVAQASGGAANSPAGSAVSVSGVAGINSQGTSGAITGGSESETDSSLRSRMLTAYSSPSQGGAAADYLKWASSVAGITRAWINPQGAGAGSVTLYVMLDIANASSNGFAVGSNGVSTSDRRGPVATGDQLRVANYVNTVRPVTSYVYVCTPNSYPVNIVLQNLSGTSSATRALISNALTTVILQSADPLGGDIFPSQLESAIQSVPGVGSFGMTVPASVVSAPLGYLPVLGTVTYA